MKLAPLSRNKFTRADWIGDAIVVIVCGAALLVSLALPWANVGSGPRDNFTYSLTKPSEISFIVSTDWGPPVLVAGLAVIALGVVMLVFGPGRWTGQPVAMVLALTALVVLYDVAAAMQALYGWGYAAGLGVLVALIVGIILPIVALASALTSRILRNQAAGVTSAAAAEPAAAETDVADA